MAQVIAQWRTMTGIRRTSSSQSVNLIVEAYHNIAEGEVQRVDFAISVNGGASSIQSVSTRQDWVPDDTTEVDPLPGCSTGPAAIPGCFGYTLSMSSYAAGYIDVTPTAYPVSGQSRVLPTIRIYNDKDGTDRRPSTKVIYVHPYGDDTRAGDTSALPVKSINKAIELCRMGGTSGGNVGGATIYLMGGIHYWGTEANGNTANTSYYTEGHHWLTITRAPWLTRNQVVIQRNENVSSWPNSQGTAAGQALRVRLKGVEVSGKSLAWTLGPWPTTNLTGHFWADGCVFYGSIDNDQDAPSINVEGSSGGVFSWNPTSGTHYTYATGTTVKMSKGGFSSFRMVRGCLVKDIVGVAIQIGNSDEGYCNIEVRNIYQNDGVKGYFPSITGNLNATIVGNRLKITAANTSVTDFGTACRYLKDKTIMGIRLSGWSTVNNGNFTVYDAGYENGLSYVILNNTNGVAQVGSSSVTMAPARMSDGSPWETILHSDIHQYNADNTSNVIFSNVRAVNTVQAQGLSDNFRPISNFAIINFTDGVPTGGNSNSYLNGIWTHGIIRHCTFLGTFLLDTTVYTRTNSEISDCYFNSLAITGTQALNGITWASNHYGPGVPVASRLGTNPTSGSFLRERFAGTRGDVGLLQNSSGYGTASTAWSRGSTFFENNRGCYANVANGCWINQPQTTITQVRTLNRTNYARSDVVTCGVPFPAGMVWSEGQTLTISGATSSPQKVQWSAFPGRHADGSIKYAKVSYRADLTANQVLDATLRLKGSYTSVPFSNSVVTQLQSTLVEFSINGNIVQIPFSGSTLIEGGGPEDQFARYRTFTRHPQAQNIWYEFTWDIYSSLDIVKFYFRFGNSIVSRGYIDSPGPYASTYNYTLSSPVTLTIRNSGDNIVYLQDYELSGYASITGGKRYTIVDNAFWQANASRFPGGFSKSFKGVILFSSSSNTANAERSSPTTTMALNWAGKVPGYYATNPVPAGITSEAVGRTYIENTFLANAQNMVPQHPYQPGKYSNLEYCGLTGDLGFGGNVFWQSFLYHIVASNWPVELPYVDFSIRTMAHRAMWFYEPNLNPVRIETFPNLVIWYGTIHDFASQDRLGYGSGFFVEAPKGPNGSSWTGIEEQHGQCSNEAFGALLTCDYLSLRIIDFWKEILAYKTRTDTPNFFMSEFMGSRDYARPMMGSVALYDYTEHPPLKKALESRINLLYSIMNAPPSQVGGAQTLYRWGCQLNGIDKLKFCQLEVGDAVGNLQNNRRHFYPWQEAFVAGALYQAYKVINSKNPGYYVAARAKEMSYQLAATNVLYTQQKFGPGSENNWDCIEVMLSSVASGTNMGPIQEWPLGSSVRGLTSGATGVIFRVKKIDGVVGWNRAMLNLKSVTGTFVAGEPIRNLTSGVTTSISGLVRGYHGSTSYYVNYVGTEQQRQTPLSVAQMEEWETTPWDEDVLGALKYIHFYTAYEKWQRTAASIVIKASNEAYYTDSGTVTAAYLRAKAIDILLDSYNYSNAITGSWDTDFWPHCMTIDNLAINLVQGGPTVLNRTVSILSALGSGSRLPLSYVTTVVSISRTVSIGSAINGTSQIPTHSASGVIVISPIVRPLAINSSSQVPTHIPRAYVVLNKTVSVSSALGGNSSIPSTTVVCERNEISHVSLNVVLEMLMDGPQYLSGPGSIPAWSDATASDVANQLIARAEVTASDATNVDDRASTYSSDQAVEILEFDPNSVDATE